MSRRQLDLLTPPELLRDARERVEAGLGDGIECPCCGQFAKQYRRKLNATMVRSLIWLVREYESTDDWVCIGDSAPAWLLRTKELATTRHWGLIEQRPHDGDSKKRTSGVWRPTPVGMLFARGLSRVPSHVYLYNNTIRGFSGDMVSARDALGDRFDYQELMGGNA